MSVIKPLEVGEVVNTVCGDWEFDNPMVVVEAEHNCHCPCHEPGMISAKGQSGKIYEEYIDTWERCDKPEGCDKG